MNDDHDLTDDQCDQLVALAMDKLAQNYSTPNGEMHAVDLNPSVIEHHALRRSIVRSAYKIGKLVGGLTPNASLTGAPRQTDRSEPDYQASGRNVS